MTSMNVADMMAITSCDERLAVQYLTLADGDLGNAIALYENIEQEGAPVSAVENDTALDPKVQEVISATQCSPSKASHCLNLVEDNVRDAIVLLQSENENVPAPENESTSFSTALDTPRSHSSSESSVDGATVVDVLAPHEARGNVLRAAGTRLLAYLPNANPFPLWRQYTMPSWVKRCNNDNYFAILSEARGMNAWVFLFLHDSSTESSNSQRAIWANPRLQDMKRTTFCCDACWTSDGDAVLQHLHPCLCGPFYMMLLNPWTRSISLEIPLTRRPSSDGCPFDVDNAMREVVEYVQQLPLPEIYAGLSEEEVVDALTDPAEQQSVSSVHDFIPSSEHGTDFHSTISPDLQGEYSERSRHNTYHDPLNLASPNEEPSSRETALFASQPNSFQRSTALHGNISLSANHSVFSLEEFEVVDNTEDGIKLRLQFPKSVLDVRLKKDTPVSALLGYCANRLHQENREAYPTTPEKPSFLGGFPPRPLELPTAPECTLGEWKAIRNGDKLIIKG